MCIRDRLYTEDTYEVAGRPYFGYLRGRFSQAELRELDQYADALGIEMIPCIQTLGHMARALRWPCMEDVRDTDDVLLLDEEKTYALIEAMIVSASRPFATVSYTHLDVYKRQHLHGRFAADFRQQ